MMRAANQRAIVACSALAVCFTALSIRLVQLQVTRHEEYAEKAARQNVHQEPIHARRGAIVDVKGNTLAQNEPVKMVVADASLIKDQAALAALLAKPLDLPAKEIRQKLARLVTTKYRKDPQPCRYIVLKKDVPEATAVEIGRLIEKAKRDKVVFTTKAVRFEQDFVRSYPNGAMLCHVLGFVNDEGSGVEGIEASMDQVLQGQDGYRFIERDRTDRELVPYRGETRAPRDGRTVRLTIDMSLQAIVEAELDAALQQFKPKKASIIMMNPKTGDIMAMANRPNFDPNPQRDAHGKPAKSALPKTPKEKEAFLERRKNIAITDQVEPGSTFKIVAASAALSEGVVRPDTEIFCENGRWSWCKLSDHHPYGSLTVQDVPRQIEQHRRCQTRHPARRPALLRVCPQFWLWGQDERQSARRDSRAGSAALQLGQAHDHAHAHGSVRGRDAAPDRQCHVYDREWRDVDVPADCSRDRSRRRDHFLSAAGDAARRFEEGH